MNKSVSLCMLAPQSASDLSKVDFASCRKAAGMGSHYHQGLQQVCAAVFFCFNVSVALSKFSGVKLCTGIASINGAEIGFWSEDRHVVRSAV